MMSYLGVRGYAVGGLVRGSLESWVVVRGRCVDAEVRRVRLACRRNIIPASYVSSALFTGCHRPFNDVLRILLVTKREIGFSVFDVGK